MPDANGNAAPPNNPWPAVPHHSIRLLRTVFTSSWALLSAAALGALLGFFTHPALSVADVVSKQPPAILLTFIPPTVIASLAALSLATGVIHYLYHRFEPTVPRELQLGESDSPRFHAGVYLFFGGAAFFSLLLFLLAVAYAVIVRSEKPAAACPPAPCVELRLPSAPPPQPAPGGTKP